MLRIDRKSLPGALPGVAGRLRAGRSVFAGCLLERGTGPGVVVNAAASVSMKNKRFHIELEHVGDGNAHTALRIALKRLLRDHKLRAIEVSPASSHVTAAIQRQRRIDSEAVDSGIMD